jgi:ABC-type proline/glycine betaine transport system permease subunit
VKDLYSAFLARRGELLHDLIQHIEISFIALFFALLIAVPLGIFLTRKKKAAELIIGVTAVFQTIPSLALLGLLIPLVGIDRKSTRLAREFYAYVNANGHLVNEGIVASRDFLSELSGELQTESQQLFRLKAPWSTYIGFAPAVPGLEYVGIRLLGMVSLKGLDNIEVGEIVPFAPGEVAATPVEAGDSLLILLRQELHTDHTAQGSGSFDDQQRADTTTERVVGSEVVICIKPGSDPEDAVLIGEWDPLSDDVHRPLRIPHADFERLFSLRGDLSLELLNLKKESVRDLYMRLSDRNFEPAIQLAEFRASADYVAFILGDEVEIL